MIRVAILDMNNNVPNLGLGNIIEIIKDFPLELEWQVFDVRHKCEIPDTSWDIYISSGGPGDPLDGDGIWDAQYYALVDALWQHNQSDATTKKYAFFVCHSFQMVAHHFQLGTITPRRSMSFGTFPAHKTEDGSNDAIFAALPDPFQVADFRHWQLIEPNVEMIEQMGAKILALEKIRMDVDCERAIMAIRFSDEFFGTQFHPEADPVGMLKWFRQPEKHQYVLTKHGKEKYDKMISDLHDPNKMALTHDTVIPNFLKLAIGKIKHDKSIVTVETFDF
jgi:homoserine O-succinyltransferase/O-acetyltransferase